MVLNSLQYHLGIQQEEEGQDLIDHLLIFQQIPLQEIRTFSSPRESSELVRSFIFFSASLEDISLWKTFSDCSLYIKEYRQFECMGKDKFFPYNLEKLF